MAFILAHPHGLRALLGIPTVFALHFLQRKAASATQPAGNQPAALLTHFADTRKADPPWLVWLLLIIATLLGGIAKRFRHPHLLRSSLQVSKRYQKTFFQPPARQALP